MIVVSNRVQVPEERAETFVDRLSTDHGIESQPGFRGMKVLAPVDAEGHVTLTFWESLEEYEQWRDGSAFDQAHDDRSSDEAFAGPNEVEIHEVVVDRHPDDAE